MNQTTITLEQVKTLSLDQLYTHVTQWSSILGKIIKNKGVQYLSDLIAQKTPYGSDFYHIAATGLLDPNDPIGLYVDWPLTYKEGMWAELLAEIIQEYHGFNVQTQNHTENFDIAELPLGDLNQDATDTCKVISTRVRYAFCLDNMPFQSAMTRAHRKESEKLLQAALTSFDNTELYGQYESLETMTPERRKQLIDDHFLSPTEEDTWLVNAGIASDWPYGRWIYLSHDKELFVLVNDEDNRMGIIQQGGDIGSVFAKFTKADKALNHYTQIAKHPKYGKLVSCPTNIGTGMRLSVMLTLPNFTKHFDVLKKVAAVMGLSVRGHYGEHSGVGGAWEVDISNKARLGVSEAQIAAMVYNGAKKLMEIEKTLVLNPEYIKQIA